MNDYSDWLKKHQELNEKLKNEIKPFNPLEVITAKKGGKISKKKKILQRREASALKQKQSQKQIVNIKNIIGEIQKPKRKPRKKVVRKPKEEKQPSTVSLPLFNRAGFDQHAYNTLSGREVVLDKPPALQNIVNPPKLGLVLPQPQAGSVKGYSLKNEKKEVSKALSEAEKESIRQARLKNFGLSSSNVKPNEIPVKQLNALLESHNIVRSPSEVFNRMESMRRVDEMRRQLEDRGKKIQAIKKMGEIVQAGKMRQAFESIRAMPKRASNVLSASEEKEIPQAPVIRDKFSDMSLTKLKKYATDNNLMIPYLGTYKVGDDDKLREQIRNKEKLKQSRKPRQQQEEIIED